MTSYKLLTDSTVHSNLDAEEKYFTLSPHQRHKELQQRGVGTLNKVLIYWRGTAKKCTLRKSASFTSYRHKPDTSNVKYERLESYDEQKLERMRWRDGPDNESAVPQSEYYFQWRSKHGCHPWRK